MAKRVVPAESRNRLEDAIALLLRTQARYTARPARAEREWRKLEREQDELFDRIDARLAEIKHLLSEQSRLLAELTRLIGLLADVVRH